MFQNFHIFIKFYKFYLYFKLELLDSYKKDQITFFFHSLSQSNFFLCFNKNNFFYL